ncbi:MAG: membrane protein insertion efficiency factor YidD [Treponema sp.]|nr:membrane protein insertion efficiency factor YidD [Treponema sp.]
MAISRRLVLLILRFYQSAVSPFFPPCCRYTPTCSAYAYEAVERYGCVRGLFLAFRRLLRCHPFHAGGYDPVPEYASKPVLEHTAGENR